MEIIYKAADGMEFRTEDACIDHEYDLGQRIYGVDVYGEKIAFEDPIFTDDITAVHLPDDIAVTLFIQRAIKGGLSVNGIDGPGDYAAIPIPGTSIWQNVDDSIEYYKRILDEFEEYKRFLE